MKPTTKKWYERIPHPVAMLFGMIVFATLLSYLLPAGTYERELVDGRQRVIPGSYQMITPTPVSLMGMFRAFSEGFKVASDIIFVVMASGIMFGILEKTRMIENSIGTLVKQLGLKNRFLIVVLMTFLFGCLGIGVGYENNIAMIPIAAVMALALGGDLILAAGISVAAITIGFGLSPINIYTVGTGHKIAEMPMFSGAILRSILCFLVLSILAFYNVRYFKKIIKSRPDGLGEGLEEEDFRLSQSIENYAMTPNNWLIFGIFIGGLAMMIFGIFNYNWHIRDITAIFLMIAILAGIFGKMSAQTISKTTLKSIAVVAPGAFMVGYATTIKVILENGNVSDTIAFHLSEVLTTLPLYGSALVMSLAQCVMNFMIPSGSGQALATLPIMIPVGEVVGLTRQCTILAFQIGDGVTNLFNPTLGGLIAMLGMCRVPFDRWLRFIMPLTGLILLIAWAFLIFAVAIEWGPF